MNPMHTYSYIGANDESEKKLRVSRRRNATLVVVILLMIFILFSATDGYYAAVTSGILSFIGFIAINRILMINDML